MALDELDRALIRATQSGLPLVPRPYEAIGATLGISGEQVRERLQAMLEAGLIRRLGAVFPSGPTTCSPCCTADRATRWHSRRKRSPPCWAMPAVRATSSIRPRS